MIASRDTMLVSRLKGKGSNGGTDAIWLVLISIQPMNKNTLNNKKVLLPKFSVMKSAIFSVIVRRASAFALMLRKTLLRASSFSPKSNFKNEILLLAIIL